MHVRRFIAIFAMILAASTLGSAATLSGSYLYDGVAVSSVFTDITGAQVKAYDYDTSQTTWGTVDTSAGTYRIENVPVGQNVLIQIELDRSQPANHDGFDGGDLIGLSVVSITSDSDSLDETVDMRSVVHFTNPFDSDASMEGTYNSCPIGGATASPATVRWNAVPRSTGYTVYVRKSACDHTIFDQTITQQTSTEVNVTLGTSGEDHVGILVECTGSAGTQLCTMPFVEMDDVVVQAYLIRDSGGATTARGTDHSDGYFVPAVARTSGSGSSYWSTSVTILNTSISQQQVEIVYTPQDGDGSTSYQSTNVAIAAGTVRTWTDVLNQLFSTTGAGSLEIRGSDLIVSSRTSTPAGGGGTYGLGIPPLTAEDLLSSGGWSTAFAGGVREVPQSWRTNFGVCEVSGKSIQVRVTIFDASGTSMGSRDINLRGYENTQINRVVRALTSTNNLDNAIIGVQVISGSGEVGAFLTVIDEATGDSTYIVIAHRSPTGS